VVYGGRVAITSGTANLMVRLREDEAEQLKKLAAQNERSVAGEIRRAVRLYLKNPSNR